MVRIIKEIKEEIEEMNYGQLQKFKTMIDKGELDRIIKKRINSIEKNTQKACPVCGAEVSRDSDLTLFFGPQEMRMKATFCAQDCLQHHLKKREEENTLKES